MPRRSKFRASALLLAAVVAAAGLTAGSARADVTVEQGTVASFDGTSIDYTLFVPGGDADVPVIFMTHGWGGSKTSDPNNATVKRLNDAGYAVMSWSQRGFGRSGGEANVDSQEFEVRDVQALIDFVALNERIQLDGEGDPRMGMLGGSYAGGIQLMTAAADRRVDAIVPQIAWHDLPQSLKPGGVLKLGWDLLLYGSGLATSTSAGLPAQTGAYNAHIHQSLIEGVALNDWSTATHAWFDAKSPKHYIDGATLEDGTVLPGIAAPTLVVQGVTDTLFNLNEGIANYNAIAARGVPAKMIWFCGGHTITPMGTSCATGDQSLITQRIDAWFAKHVKGESVDTGPAIEYQLQDGTWASAATLPDADWLEGTASTKVTNTVAPTSGQVAAGTPAGCRPGAGRTECPTPPQAEWIPVGSLTGPPGPPGCVPEPDPEDPSKIVCEPTFEFPKAGSVLLGSPRVKVRVNSSSPESYLFFKLIDYDKTARRAVVIDDQVTALRSTWSGLAQPRVHVVELAGIAWQVKPDHEIYLEISPTSNDHASSRYPGSTSLVVDVAVPFLPAAA